MLSKIQAHSFSQSMPESATSTRYSGTQNHSKLGQGLKFLLIAALSIFVTACGGGGGATPGPVTLTSIAIEPDRKSTRLNSSHPVSSRMPSSA